MAHIFGFLIVWAVFWILFFLNVPGGLFLLYAPHTYRKRLGMTWRQSYDWMISGPKMGHFFAIWLALAPIQWLPSMISWARGDHWTFGGVLLALLLAAGSALSIYFAWRHWEMTRKSIFDLIPQHQQAEVRQFIEEQSQAPSLGGELLDLSNKTPEAVIAAIKQEVIGQDRIVEDVVRFAFRRAALARPNKPVGVAMFVGATGAGKTELAKALANTLAEGRLIRVDCNEMTDPFSATKLIGAAPGYIGSERGGWLCREIGTKGTGVILFDEIEKAHPDVFKLIMGLLDEGRLTEQSTGHTYRATGFLIVMTSNAEHEQIAEIVKTIPDPADRAGKVKDVLRSVFKPEQLARMDEIYAFGELEPQHIAEIIGKFLFGFAQQVGVELVEVDGRMLLNMLTQREKLKKYGVREVIRLVEKAVIDGMLEARASGAKFVRIVVTNNNVHVLPAAAAGQAGFAGS